MDEDERKNSAEYSTEMQLTLPDESASSQNETREITITKSPQLRESLVVETEDENDAEIGDIVSKKELYSWYTYDWANSVYLNSIIGSFLPSFLTYLAQQNSHKDGKLHFLGSELQPASFFTYSVTCSVILQALLFVFIGGMADFGTMRKPMLVVTGCVGAVASMCTIFVYPSVYWLGGIILIVSNVGFGLSVVFYNSFLPLLVRNHPEVRATADLDNRAELEKTLDKRISNIGYIAGYLGGVVMLIINVGVFLVTPGSCIPKCNDCPNADPDICPEEPECPSDYDPNNCDDQFWGYRINIALAGLWWLGWGLFTYIFLLPRASKPLPEGTHYITEGMRKLKTTLKDLKKLPNSFRFLFAYWLYSDGISTMNSGAALVATELLSFDGTKLGIALIAANLSAGLGNWVYFKISQQSIFGHKIQVKHIICVNIIVAMAVNIYIRVPGTIKYDIEFFVIAVVFGFQNGSVQSFSRVMLSRLAPAGHEAEFFSFYELTDKGTSWAGPLVMGIVLDYTGDLRWSVFAVLFFLVSGMIALYFGVNESQGIEEVKRFEMEEREKTKVDIL